MKYVLYEKIDMISPEKRDELIALNNKINWIPICIILFCVFLTAIAIYFEQQKKEAILGLNISLDSDIKI